MNAILVMINGLKVLYISMIANMIEDITEITSAVYRCGGQSTHPLNVLIDGKYTSIMST